jgi:ATP-binding protein involved in chromosome partitioning
MSIRETADSGHPIVESDPDGPHAAIYRTIAGRIRDQLQSATAVVQRPPTGL